MAIAKSMASAAAFALAVQPAFAQRAAEPPSNFAIGYVDLAEDPRFDPEYAYYRIPVRPWGRSIDGARLGVADAEAIGRVIDVAFTLRERSGASVQDLIPIIEEWTGQGVNFVIADLPADQLLALADGVGDLPITLLNVSAQEDSLRGQDCRPNIVHTIPSHRMVTDAMVQFLVSKRWKDILVLQGPSAQDQAVVEALRQSSALFGARIVDVRPFVLTADPRQRDRSNVALMTAEASYDVVYIADSDGEFARNVPYDTNSARPVVGAAGLVAEAWHWSWERYGAPQLNARFEKTSGRRMHDFDWAAWVAARALTQSVLRSKSTEYEPVRNYLLGERMNLDGVKGNPMSVRPWDQQLRQGMLLTAGNVVARLAPIEGFLHQINDLDTLGVDARQSDCQF